MPTIYDAAHEGYLNLPRAQRWIWNYNTFLSAQPAGLWAHNPVCLTFSKASIQHLLKGRSDNGTGATIQSAGIRFHLSLYNPATQHSVPNADKCYMQLIAVRSESMVLFSGNSEVVHNDAFNIAPDHGIFAYDSTLSSNSRSVSPFNPAQYQGTTGPWGQEHLPYGLLPGFPVGADNEVERADVLPFIEQYHHACQPGGAIHQLNGQHTVTCHFEGGTEQFDFNVYPEQWPRAFFFEKDWIISSFGNPANGLLNNDIRIYFGITDEIDSIQTGETPGILKLIMIGAGSADASNGNMSNDLISEDGSENNHILDFSLPCPNMCGNTGHRLYDPNEASN